MSNPYFTFLNPLIRHTLGRAEQVNATFQAIQAGFDKLPPPEEINAERLPKGTLPLEAPRNTDLAGGAFTPYEPLSLWPVYPEGPHQLSPDDSGKLVWSHGHDITLPAARHQVLPGWRIVIKNIHPSSSLTLDAEGGSTIDGAPTLTLAAGEARMLVMGTTDFFGSL